MSISLVSANAPIADEVDDKTFGANIGGVNTSLADASDAVVVVVDAVDEALATDEVVLAKALVVIRALVVVEALATGEVAVTSAFEVVVAFVVEENLVVANWLKLDR